jgi:predicted SAM-dependent methyltransferase
MMEGTRKKQGQVLLKLDLGCGQNKRPGFAGVDRVAIAGVDIVHDLCTFPWPWESGTVEEVWCSHYFEHVPGKLRGRWMDELYRILIPGGKATVIVPYFASMRSVQDYTHEWPPVCEMSFVYFNKNWRAQTQLDHYGLRCDFDASYRYIMDTNWEMKDEEARAFAARHYREVVMDLHVELTKRSQT